MAHSDALGLALIEGEEVRDSGAEEEALPLALPGAALPSDTVAARRGEGVTEALVIMVLEA